MRQGITVQELASEVQGQVSYKNDYLAPAAAISLDESAHAHINGIDGTWSVTGTAHRQIGEYAGIPATYYDKMLSQQPDLLAQNVNRWFQEKGQDVRLTRHLGSHLRALLSDRYRPLDNLDLMTAAFPALAQFGGQFEIVSCALTEERLYLKAVTPRLEGEVRRGDVIRGGIYLSNSEVGHGSVLVKPFFERLACTNGAVSEIAGTRSSHVGKSNGGDDGEARKYLTDEAREAEDRAFWLRFRDSVAYALSDEVFTRILNGLKDAADEPIPNPLVAVEAVSQRYGFTEGEQNAVLENLMTGGDYTLYGLMNAVTRTAEDAPSYDRATQLEAVGPAVLGLNPAEWVAVTPKR